MSIMIKSLETLTMVKYLKKDHEVQSILVINLVFVDKKLIIRSMSGIILMQI